MQKGLGDREDGNPQPPLSAHIVPLPGRVWLEDKGDSSVLCWAPREDNTLRVADVEGALEAFLALANASDDAILTFAQRWGTLLLCADHQLPAPHDSCRPAGREPVAAWRRLSRRAGALLLVADALHEGREAPRELVYLMCGYPPPPGPGGLQLPTAGAPLKLQVTRSMQEWLSFGNVRPVFGWEEAAPRVALWGRHLAGALAAALMFTVARSAGQAMCSGCGRLYLPKRKPQSGRLNYCVVCVRTPRNAGRDGEVDLRVAWRVNKRMRRAGAPPLWQRPDKRKQREG